MVVAGMPSRGRASMMVAGMTSHGRASMMVAGMTSHGPGWVRLIRSRILA
jgi:hypothetical protein